MINNNAKAMIIALALLAQPMQTRTYPTDPSVAVFDDVATIASLGIVAAGCYAAYAGLNYLWTPSNEAIINKAQSVEAAACNYAPVINYLRSVHHRVTEREFCELAQNHVRGSFPAYKQGMSNTLNEIRSSLKNLNDRMQTFDDNGQRYSREYTIMSAFVGRLGAIEFELKCVYEILNHLSSCFELYAFNAKMRTDYVHVLSMVESCGNDGFSLIESLHRYIINSASYFSSYPMLSYVETLDHNIFALGNAIKNRNVYSSYTNLIVGAHDIYNKLCFVRSVLVASHRYAYEVQAREQARREQARLERERMAAQQALAKMQAEMRAMERQRIQMLQQHAPKHEVKVAQRIENQANRDLQLTMGFE